VTEPVVLKDQVCILKMAIVTEGVRRPTKNCWEGVYEEFWSDLAVAAE